LVHEQVYVDLIRSGRVRFIITIFQSQLLQESADLADFGLTHPRELPELLRSDVLVLVAGELLLALLQLF